jgi:hypothetical protein
MSLPEAPASKLAPASNAACAFSVTIRSASRRADLPPTISFIILSAITVFASTANIIKGVKCRRLIALPPGRLEKSSRDSLHWFATQFCEGKSG